MLQKVVLIFHSSSIKAKYFIPNSYPKYQSESNKPNPNQNKILNPVVGVPMFKELRKPKPILLMVLSQLI